MQIALSKVWGGAAQFEEAASATQDVDFVAGSAVSSTVSSDAVALSTGSETSGGGGGGGSGSDPAFVGVGATASIAGLAPTTDRLTTDRFGRAVMPLKPPVLAHSKVRCVCANTYIYVCMYGKICISLFAHFSAMRYAGS